MTQGPWHLVSKGVLVESGPYRTLFLVRKGFGFFRLAVSRCRSPGMLGVESFSNPFAGAFHAYKKSTASSDTLRERYRSPTMGLWRPNTIS